MFLPLRAPLGCAYVPPLVTLSLPAMEPHGQSWGVVVDSKNGRKLLSLYLLF